MTVRFGAPGMSEALEKMAASTAYMKDDLMQAAVVLSDVGEVGKLSASQLEKLTQAATGLAATSVRPELMDNVSSSAAALGKALTGMDRGLKLEGIQTNDNYMATVAFGGSLKDTWSKMSEAAQMQARYQAILDQMKSSIGGATTDQGAYNRSVRESKQAFEEAKEALGMKLIPTVKWLSSEVAKIPTPVLAGGLAATAAGGLATAVIPAAGLMKMGVSALKGGSGVVAGAAGAEVAMSVASGAAGVGATAGVSAGAAAAGGLLTVLAPVAVAAVAAAGGILAADAISESVANKGSAEGNQLTRFFHAQEGLGIAQRNIENAKGLSGWQTFAPALSLAKRLGLAAKESDYTVAAREQAGGVVGRMNQALAMQEYQKQLASGVAFFAQSNGVSTRATQAQAVQAILEAPDRGLW